LLSYALLRPTPAAESSISFFTEEHACIRGSEVNNHNSGLDYGESDPDPVDLPSRARKWMIALLVPAVLFGLVFGINHIMLQGKMNDVIRADFRNAGLKVSTHYGFFVNPTVLVYDLRSVPADKAPADVFRLLLEFAESVSDQEFGLVKLAYRGRVKFLLDGSYFQQIGREYEYQNPVYLARTFPEHLMKPDGTRAYPVWTGGLIGVSLQQMKDFLDFHSKWYIQDLMSS